MRDLIEAAERAVVDRDIQAFHNREKHLMDLAAHPDFFPALKLYADMKAGDPALVERLAEVAATIRLLDGSSTDTVRAIMQELTK